MIRHGSAYTMSLIKMEPFVKGPGEVVAIFSDRDRTIFSATLEICSVDMMARACAESLAASDWSSIWIEAPNPNAAADMLRDMPLDKAGMLRQVEEARAKLDAIEAAILAREDIEEIEEVEPGQATDLERAKELILAMSLPQLERLLAAIEEEETEAIPANV